MIKNADFKSLPEGIELAEYVKESRVNGDHVSLQIAVPFPCEGIKADLATEIEEEITKLTKENVELKRKMSKL